MIPEFSFGVARTVLSSSTEGFPLAVVKRFVFDAAGGWYTGGEEETVVLSDPTA